MKTSPVFFQDLPIEYQELIFDGLSKELHTRNREKIDDYINCNNTPSNVIEWVNDFCL